MVRQTARAWVAAVVALLAAGAGMSALSSGSPTTSPLRLAVAAGVLSGYATAVALVLTQRAARSWWRCLWWGATVPAVVGLVTAGLVAPAAGAVPALLSGLPWLLGAVAVSALGPWLPSLRLPARLRRSTRGSSDGEPRTLVGEPGTLISQAPREVGEPKP
jgi:hypothetical protein